ncbi:MAG: adenylate/guanylate cyclase domain-containing protein [Alphaproteobacteria bacterium]|nr:adenylate/guanylate cyclase domain-containing protein [Alphaproteobacteria bacterium]
MLYRWLHIIIPVVLIALAAAVNLRVEAVQEFQLRVFDLYQRIAPRPYEPVAVKYVDIDDRSLEALGQWPWPRTRIAELVARLANAGAVAIAFDIVFAEPDRTSPRQVIPLWPATPEVEALQAAIDTLPDHDAILADVIAQAPVVAGFVLTAEATVRRPEAKVSFARAGNDPTPFLPNFRGGVTSLPALEKGAIGNGSFNLVPERDGIVRRVPLALRIGDTIYPSLAAEAVRVGQGARTPIIKSVGANLETGFGEQTGIVSFKIGRIEVPTDDSGRLWIHFTPRSDERRISAAEVLGEDFDEGRVNGQIVFIGTSAAGLFDLRPTPLDPAAPGVEIHVQAVEQMLLGHYLERPDWAPTAELLYMIALGLLLIALLPRLGAAWSALAAVVGVGFAVGVSWYLYAGERWLVDPLYASAVVALVFVSSSALNFLRTEGEKRQVRGAFAQYLSPALVEQLAADPGRLKLGGEMKNMTFLFCDVRGFTAISETFKTNPQGLTRLINKFLTPMTNIILERQGTIDKYMGDCIMAFWNAPLDDAEHARHACTSALAMFEHLPKLNEQLEAEAEKQPFYPIKIGIGLNTGDCVVGNMGSDRRFDYSVLGDAVNLASRLEGQSKTYGMNVVIGQETRAQAMEYAAIELDQIAVKGKKEAVRIFGLLGAPEMAASAPFQAFAAKHREFLPAYRGQRWDEAEAVMTECRVLAQALIPAGLDDFYDLYAERIAEYRTNPPPPQWDGVYVATSK